MAWYQRSYKNLEPVKLLNLLIVSILFILIIDNKFVVNCLSFRNTNQYTLRDLNYKNIFFKCSYNINNAEAFLAIDNLIENLNQYRNKSFAKYYENSKGILIPFEKSSCYSHPNLFIGSFNNILYNYQFTHNNYNNLFFRFTHSDVFGRKKNQFAPFYLNLYDNDLAQIYLNKKDLCFNEIYLNNNENIINKCIEFNKETQSYIDINSSGLDNIIRKSLNKK